MNNSISWKAGLAIGVGLLVSAIAISSVSVNDGGYRTVIQGPTGTMSVKFTEGWYFAPFSKETVYPNVMSYDLDEGGLSVRYQDGGRGTVDGNVRVQLPNDEAAMLKFHREFLSVEGAMTKLVIPEVKQALNQTAGLLTSEEAYAEKRSNIAEWAEAIMENGRFVTRTVTREITMSDGTKQRKQIPEIATKDGQPQHQGSPFKEYSLQVSGFQVTNIDFESATQTQIDEKRKAEMASITARANADKAAWEEKQVEAEGKKLVAQRRYEQLQLNEKEILLAEREKQTAVIAAQKVKEVNQEQLLAAKIDVQTAREQAEATMLRAKADAEAKRLLMEADGALQVKADTAIQINKIWAEAYQNRTVTDVPSIVMGSNGTNTSGSAAASNFMQMMEAKLAKDLQADFKINQ